MKFCHASLFLGVLVAFVPSAGSAFVATFPSGPPGFFTPQGADVNGIDGWTVGVDGAPGDSGALPGGHLAWVSTYLTSTAVALGGVYNYPATTLPATAFLSHEALGELQYATFSVKFDIQPSTENTDVTFRDGFGFSFRDKDNSNLLTISLVPVVTPAMDAYQVCYTVGAGSQTAALDGNNDPMYIYQYGPYTMNLALLANGANPTFSGTVIGTNTKTFTGVATNMGSTAIDRVGAVWNVTDAGDNYIVFDNLSLVPEPSSALLLGLTGIGLALRRRRA